MFGYIYETTNTINNKKYIGQHKSKTFDNKYYGSGKLLSQAINKYGIDNFKTILLEECDNQEELDSKEMFYIAKYREMYGESNCYNIMAGGLTIRSWNKGKKNIYSKETIAKMAEARRIAMSDKVKREQISNSLKGKPLSEERRRKISEGTKKAMQRPEVKEKLKISNKNKRRKKHE